MESLSVSDPESKENEIETLNSKMKRLIKLKNRPHLSSLSQYLKDVKGDKDILSVDQDYIEFRWKSDAALMNLGGQIKQILRRYKWRSNHLTRIKAYLVGTKPEHLELLMKYCLSHFRNAQEFTLNTALSFYVGNKSLESLGKLISKRFSSLRSLTLCFLQNRMTTDLGVKELVKDLRQSVFHLKTLLINFADVQTLTNNCLPAIGRMISFSLKELVYVHLLFVQNSKIKADGLEKLGRRIERHRNLIRKFSLNFHMTGAGIDTRCYLWDLLAFIPQLEIKS